MVPVLAVKDEARAGVPTAVQLPSALYPAPRYVMCSNCADGITSALLVLMVGISTWGQGGLGSQCPRTGVSPPMAQRSTCPAWVGMPDDRVRVVLVKTAGVPRGLRHAEPPCNRELMALFALSTNADNFNKICNIVAVRHAEAPCSRELMMLVAACCIMPS
jgi:hypothetical protein